MFKYYYGILKNEKTVWITPGGKVEEGEDYNEALKREVYEEVGLQLESEPKQICYRNKLFILKSGEHVMSHEKYFLVFVDKWDLSFDSWTDNEKEYTKDWKWWRLEDIARSSEEFFSKDITNLLTNIFNGESSQEPVEIY